jgi:hypothetical protein
MLLIAALALAIVWATVIVVVVGLCRDAARGDRALRPVARAAHEPAHLRLIAS